jgi:inosine/xanthosine triphosphate pyrophosphatase family protein
LTGLITFYASPSFISQPRLHTASMAPKQLNFITGNKNKLVEVRDILGDIVDLQSRSLDLVEIQGTIDEISADKCRRAAEAVSIGRPLIASHNLRFSGQWSGTC